MLLTHGHSSQAGSYRQECKSLLPNSFFFGYLNGTSGYSFLEGDSIFISNLSNGIDLYSLRTMQRLRHYEAPVTINVPLQVSLARHTLDRVIMGGVDGTVRIYDRATGELVDQLEHKVSGRVQVVDVGTNDL